MSWTVIYDKTGSIFITSNEYIHDNVIINEVAKSKNRHKKEIGAPIGTQPVAKSSKKNKEPDMSPIFNSDERNIPNSIIVIFEL